MGPLPAGRHGFSREQVSHNQRERLLAALSQVVNERGYGDVTVADITVAAQVSRRTFYEHFKSKEACFLAAFDVVVEYVHRLIDEATEPVPDWPHKTAVGIATTLRFFVAEPDLAHLSMVDSLTAGPTVVKRYRDVVLGFAPLLKPGRNERIASRSLPDSTEDTIIGGLASVIARQIMSGGGADLEDLQPDFTAFALTPFLGPEEAGRIAAEAVEL